MDWLRLKFISSFRQKIQPTATFKLPAPILGGDLPEIDLCATEARVAENMQTHGRSLDRLVKAVEQGQNNAVSNYTITVNNLKEVRQVEGTQAGTNDPDLAEVLREAKNLVK